MSYFAWFQDSALSQGDNVVLQCNVSVNSESIDILILTKIDVHSEVYFGTGTLFRSRDQTRISYRGLFYAAFEFRRMLITIHCQNSRIIKLVFTGQESITNFAMELVSQDALATITNQAVIQFIGPEITEAMERAFNLMGRDWPSFIISKAYLEQASFGDRKYGEVIRQYVFQAIAHEINLHYREMEHTILGHLARFPIRFNRLSIINVVQAFRMILYAHSLRVVPQTGELEPDVPQPESWWTWIVKTVDRFWSLF